MSASSQFKESKKNTDFFFSHSGNAKIKLSIPHLERRSKAHKWVLTTPTLFVYDSNNQVLFQQTYQRGFWHEGMNSFLIMGPLDSLNTSNCLNKKQTIFYHVKGKKINTDYSHFYNLSTGKCFSKI